MYIKYEQWLYFLKIITKNINNNLFEMARSPPNVYTIITLAKLV